MSIQALGYMVIGSDQLDDWGDLATRLLGMQQVDRGRRMRAFRMDDRSQRLLVAADAAPATIGWEVADAGALDALAARLEDAGIRVAPGGRALADERHVAGLITFPTRRARQLEAFHGPVLADQPFAPGRPISGFRTGALGMGHAVLHVADAGLARCRSTATCSASASPIGRTSPTRCISST